MTFRSPARPGACAHRPVPFALLAALATLSTAAMDMVAPLLATLDRTLPGAAGHPGLVVSMFATGSAIAQLVCGPVSDRLGRRALLLSACAVYVLASAGCAVAESFAALAACRLAVGAGAGVCLALAFAVIRDTTSAQATATRVAQVTAAMWGSSIVAAPLASGLLVAFGWRTVFVLLTAASLALLAALARWLPETLELSRRQTLSLRRVASGYRAVIGCVDFRAHAVMGAMAFSTLFVIGIGAMALLRVSTGAFGLVYGGVIAGLSAGSILGNALLARRMPTVRLQGAAAALLLATSGALLLVARVGPGSVFHAAIATLLMTFASLAIGVLTPCSIAGGVAPFGQRAGTAASALGIVRMLASALVSAGVALLGADDPVVVGAAMSICAAVAFAAWLRVRAPVSARVSIGAEAGDPGAEPIARRPLTLDKAVHRMQVVHGSLDHDPVV